MGGGGVLNRLLLAPGHIFVGGSGPVILGGRVLGLVPFKLCRFPKI